VVQLNPEGKRKKVTPAFYVGVIVEWKDDQGGWLIRCMRRVSAFCTHQFCYPDLDDVCLYSPLDIMKRLSIPKIVGRREVYHFDVTQLTDYVHALR
jgi:hypothetical protein